MAQVQLVLETDPEHTRNIVAAFDEFVARPLERQLIAMSGRDLTSRNPMIYTARGIDTVAEWIAAVLADKETSAFEGLLGTWQEEVATIVSGGTKPAGGIDLQVPAQDGVVSLYAIQTAPNTKNAAGRKNDIAALRNGAAVLSAQRMHTELYIAVLHGRRGSAPHPKEPGITMLGSDDFWERVSGVRDFRARLLQATTVLAELIAARSSDEVHRIRAEAQALYDDGDGRLKMNALANPPRKVKVDLPEQLALALT